MKKTFKNKKILKNYKNKERNKNQITVHFSQIQNLVILKATRTLLKVDKQEILKNFLNFKRNIKIMQNKKKNNYQQYNHKKKICIHISLISTM